MTTQAPSKERVPPKTDLEWIAHTLSDAEAAIKVLSTMLAKEGLKMGFAVADEILGNVRSAQKNCSHLIERERRASNEPPAGQPTVDYLDRLFSGADLPPESGDILYADVTKEQWQAAKAELIARRHGLTAEQVSNARESLLDAVAERVRAAQPPLPARSELELAAIHYVKIAKTPELSRYITENGRHPHSGGPWAELVNAVNAASSSSETKPGEQA